jgi:hypothetical protein
MKESQNMGNQIIRFSSLIMLLIFTHPNLSLARPRPCVDVKIEAERHVCTPHIMKDLIFLPLKLTYHIPATDRDKTITISIPPGDGGLVVEHIARDGTTTTQSFDPEPWWFSKAETLQIKSSTLQTYFNLWILPGIHLDFSKLGIYHISYAHPWAETKEDPNNVLYRSNTLTIMLVTEERANQIHKILHDNPELALASYKFKNPPSACEMPKYKRSIPQILDKAVNIGAGMDEVLLLLGPPDIAGYTSTDGQKIYSYDDEWFYETSPAGDCSVHFKNGRVVSKAMCGDWSGEN